MKISTRAGGTEDLAVCILAVWGQDVYWGAKPRLVRRVIAGMRVFCAPEALGKGGSFNSALHSIPQLSISLGPRSTNPTRNCCDQHGCVAGQSVTPQSSREFDSWGHAGEG